MTPKKIVESYYEADLANSDELLENFLHEECQLNWHSSKGFRLLNFKDIKVIYNDIKKNYKSTRVNISHILAEGNTVTTRYSLLVTPLETPDEEQLAAHFITIWELRDDKLYRGYEVSQLADTSEESINSFR